MHKSIGEWIKRNASYIAAAVAILAAVVYLTGRFGSVPV